MGEVRHSLPAQKASAGKGTGKLKEMLLAPRYKYEGKILETDLMHIPIIRQCDNAKLLPKYTGILAKSEKDGLSMDELDQLQQELEKLLSSVAIRIRYLLSETEIDGGSSSSSGDIHEKKAHEKTSLKRKWPDERPKFKDVKNGARDGRKNYGSPLNKFLGDSQLYKDIPKVTLPKNDNSDKFWTAIEPFCANINKDDIAFLDSLIQEFSKEINFKIPDIGEHYTNAWLDEILNEECNLGKSPTKKACINLDFKKHDIHAMAESFSASPSQNRLGAFIEERILKSISKKGENGIKPTSLKSMDMTKLKAATANQKIGLCLNKRLKLELVKQGVLSMDDVNTNVSDDEILTELKKCQKELLTVNDYNIDELKNLKTIARNELHCNELKEHLEKVDRQILELYNKIVISRKKAQQQEDGGEPNKAAYTEQAIKKFEAQADTLLKQQIELNREINGLMDMQTLY